MPSQRRLVSQLTSLYGPYVLGGAHLCDALQSFSSFLVGCENTHHMLLAPRLLLRSPLGPGAQPRLQIADLCAMSGHGASDKGTRAWVGICGVGAGFALGMRTGPRTALVGPSVSPRALYPCVNRRLWSAGGSYLVKFGTTVKKVHVCENMVCSPPPLFRLPRPEAAPLCN